MNEDLKKIFSQGNMVVYILWGALTFSQLIYAFLIYINFLGDPKTGRDLITSEPTGIGNILIFACLIAALISAYFFNKNRDIQILQQEMKGLGTDLDPNAQLTPGQLDALKSADDNVRRYFNLRNRILTRYILAWACNGVLAIAGIVGIMLGMGRVHAYSFIATGIALNILMFPKVREHYQRLCR